MDDTLLPITYRPIVLFSIGLWGWALDLFILAKCGIDTNSILQLNNEKHSPLYTPIFYLSGILSLIVSLCLVSHYLYNPSPFNAIIPYILALILLLWPSQFYKKERTRFIR